jgi:hypothetical protein
MIDQNPQTNTPELEVPDNATDMQFIDAKEGGYWACPVCEDDGHLMDITEESQLPAPSTPVEDKQTEPNKQPLYKVLNSKRTQGEWVPNDYSKSNIFEPHFEVSSPETKRKVFDTPVVESEDEANAQYTALAVNNLHILAEALEKIILWMQSLKRHRYFVSESLAGHHLQNGEQALQNIS